MKKYRRLSYTDRLKIETLYNIAKMRPSQIAKQLNLHHSSVTYELQKGFYQHRNSDWTNTVKYSAYKAQQAADYQATSKGVQLKIGTDYDFVATIEELILKRHLSPAAALAEIRRRQLPVKTNVCVATLYRYIRQGLFPHITDKNLPYRGKRRNYRRVKPVKQPPKGTSIELRPIDVLLRNDFGHWELDSVIGKNEKGDTLLVLTERKTRYELIYRSKDKTAASTVQMLNRLERRFGTYKFRQIFKTITCDNGPEFLDVIHMESSVMSRGNRTAVYYCHPYSSYERGSNENQNRIIRRFIEKGVPIKNYTNNEIAEAARYMNTMPRKLLNWQTSQECFIAELRNLGINFFNFLRNSY